MGGATNCPETPRQKMIGMMYIVLTAMLALNVSADILNGFTMVQQSLKVSTDGAERRNENLYGKFEDLNGQNPAKVGAWLAKAKEVKAKSDELYKQIEAVKLEIVKTVDGPEGNLDHIEGRDNLDAAGRVCLAVDQGGKGEGPKLKKAMEAYSTYLQGLLKSDPSKVALIKKTFDTGKVVGHDGSKQKWEVATFEMMPVAAVVTILSKIQSDIRNSEGDVVNYLKSMVDADDYRVNKIEAVVIPKSQYVIQGGKYEAKIALVASDSTKTPEVYVGGSLIKGGLFQRAASSIGDQKFSGFIRLASPSGAKTYPFTSEYIVGAPSVTISADKMNVFYAGIANPVSISVPGVASSSISASMSGGVLRKVAKGGWVVMNARPGANCVISVSAKIDGKVQKMGSKAFRVKPLPPPVAYLPLGAGAKYKGGSRISKAQLLGVDKVLAELNDADIEANFRVLCFELDVPGAMGTVVERSGSMNITDRQKQYIKGFSKGNKFFISGIKAIGPDGITRNLPPIEVVL